MNGTKVVPLPAGTRVSGVVPVATLADANAIVGATPDLQWLASRDELGESRVAFVGLGSRSFALMYYPGDRVPEMTVLGPHTGDGLDEVLAALNVAEEQVVDRVPPAVTKSAFVSHVANRSGLRKTDAGKAVEAMIDTIQDALTHGREVKFSGFGKFSVTERTVHETVHPRTGEKVTIAAAKLPKFTAANRLKKVVTTEPERTSRRPSRSRPR